jgi:hypothetical protein
MYRSGYEVQARRANQRRVRIVDKQENAAKLKVCRKDAFILQQRGR